MHADSVAAAKERELGACRQFKVFPAVQMVAPTKDVFDTRWALAWKEVKGKKKAKCRREAGKVLAGCVSRRSSHLQLISSGASKRWEIWSLDITNAFRQAGGSNREVFARALCEWDSKNARRIGS